MLRLALAIGGKRAEIARRLADQRGAVAKVEALLNAVDTTKGRLAGCRAQVNEFGAMLKANQAERLRRGISRAG